MSSGGSRPKDWAGCRLGLRPRSRRRRWPSDGNSGPAGRSLASCLYFSAETYTSLGFGDLTPVGPLRMIAGVEALNGLLLIGWSASYAYIAMERFWNEDASRH